MKKITTGAKWTRGRSTVERVTKGTKANLAMKQHALHLPLRLLNTFLKKK